MIQVRFREVRLLVVPSEQIGRKTQRGCSGYRRPNGFFWRSSATLTPYLSPASLHNHLPRCSGVSLAHGCRPSRPASRARSMCDSAPTSGDRTRGQPSDLLPLRGLAPGWAMSLRVCRATIRVSPASPLQTTSRVCQIPLVGRLRPNRVACRAARSPPTRAVGPGYAGPDVTDHGARAAWRHNVARGC